MALLILILSSYGSLAIRLPIVFSSGVIYSVIYGMADLLALLVLTLFVGFLLQQHKGKSSNLRICKIFFVCFVISYCVQLFLLFNDFIPSFSTGFNFWALLTFIFVPVFLILPAYIAYKALTDKDFYQRFFVSYPTDVLHPKHSNIYRDN